MSGTFLSIVQSLAMWLSCANRQIESVFSSILLASGRLPNSIAPLAICPLESCIPSYFRVPSPRALSSTTFSRHQKFKNSPQVSAHPS